MTARTFFVSEASLRNLKQLAMRRASGVSSSHMSESIAAALGFRTHAALRAVLVGYPTAEVLNPSNERLNQRLREFGYPAPADLRLLPELNQSVTPFRSFPLRKRCGGRWQAWRALMVTAINAGLAQRLFGLSPGQDWWPGANPEGCDSAWHSYEFTLLGLPAIARVNAISGDELSFDVVLNPSARAREVGHWGDFRDGDAAGHCWLERRLGAWIQDSGPELSCRRPVQTNLCALEIQPAGFGDLGSFYL